MKKNRNRNRIAAMILGLIMAFCMIPVQGLAQGKIEVDRESSVAIHYVDTDGIPDALFDVYKVADLDEYAKVTLTGAFQSYPIDTKDLDQDGWNELALTLKGYALRDKIAPDYSGKTDENGDLRLPTSGMSMKPGIYLAVGYRVTTEDFYTYSASPFMVYVPERGDGNTWNYDIDAFVKFEKEYNPPEIDEKFVTYKAIKIWDDKGNEKKRPKTISVSLLCDGQVYDTQVLDKNNNWRYSWDNLENKHDWLVVENEQQGYTTKVTKEGITFTVENTYTENPPEEGGGGKLPQTGMLWWPVPALLGCGLICVIIGMLRRRKESDEER